MAVVREIILIECGRPAHLNYPMIVISLLDYNSAFCYIHHVANAVDS